MKEILPETTMQEIVNEMRSEGMALAMQSLVYGPDAEHPTEEFMVVLAQGPMIQIMTQVMQKITHALQQARPDAISTERIEYTVDDPMKRRKEN